MNYLVRPSGESKTKFELYRLLCDAGFHVDPEYSCLGEGRKRCRFDLVLHDGEEVFLLIEVKGAARRRKTYSQFQLSYQYRKYAEFGVPLVYVTAYDDLSLVVRSIIGEYPERRWLTLPLVPLPTPRDWRPRRPRVRVKKTGGSFSEESG